METTKTIPNYHSIQNAQTWIGGPSHTLQRQYIPGNQILKGYRGNVPSLKAEGLHGKNFGRITAQCLNNRVKKGFQIDQQQRFKTNYIQEYNKPDQRKYQSVNKAQQLLKKLNKQQQIRYLVQLEKFKKTPKTILQVPPIDRMHIVGYMGYKPTFRHPLKKSIKLQQVIPPKQPISYKDDLRKLEKNLQEQLLQKNEKFLKKIQGRNCPIVGYNGFLKGVKSGNKFGQTFHNICLNSIRN